MNAPIVFQYQQALDEFRREGHEPPLLKRMSELISLLDLTTTLSSSLSGRQILDAALLIVMGELQVGRGALYIAQGDGRFRLCASRGLPAGAPRVVECGETGEEPFAPEPPSSLATQAGLVLLSPVRKGGRTIALVGLGPRMEGRSFQAEERGFLQSLSACAATPIENGLMYEELRRVNRSLSVKVFQLHNLFDIGRELTALLDEDAIERLAITSVMGHFLASRCAVYRLGDDGRLRAAQTRGLRPQDLAPVLPEDAARVLFEHEGPRPMDRLAEGDTRSVLQTARLALAVPLAGAERASGVLLVGERPAGRPYESEEIDFAAALARQVQAAIEAARLHRLRIEKERQDRDLQIAREIQRTLLPRVLPKAEHFDLSALSRSCYQVGGDYYDAIPLGDGRLALVVGDVSGKGTPASLMMASVHASLQAMAGTAPPADWLSRLNRFLFEKTGTSRYVTLFYGELDAARRRLVYVTAGHVPPYLVRGHGACERLRRGGPVVGLLEDARFESGSVELAAGDLLAVVTDGVTEAESEGGEEFGDSRVLAALSSGAEAGAEATRDHLVRAVDDWVGDAGCGDDLTVLILRAT